MGLYEEAVDLALKVDIELAKIYADKPEEVRSLSLSRLLCSVWCLMVIVRRALIPPQEDEDLRKKLWLRIARHVVEEQKDIKKCGSLDLCLYLLYLYVYMHLYL
jgi:hypothetical protein